MMTSNPAWFKPLLLAVILLFFHQNANGQDIVFVNHAAVGSNDGTSWGNAFISLQDALASWQSGNVIWVAQGRYAPDQGQGITSGDRLASFELQSGQTLYGGFSGTETTLDQRNVDVYETILSGDLLGDDAKGYITNDPLREDNSESIILVEDIAGNPPVVLDGFSVSGGNSNRLGGGMYVASGGHAVVRNSVFRNNVALFCGGAIASLGTISIFDSTFLKNRAGLQHTYCVGGTGGAVYQSMDQQDSPAGLPTPTIERTLFEQNSTMGCGGALGIGPGGAEITDVVFLLNESDWGGAVCVRGTSHDYPAVFSNSLFTGNRAHVESGGAMVIEGGVVDITNSVFSGNSVSELSSFGGGGAFYLDDQADVMVYNSSFSNNWAAKRGTAFYNAQSSLKIYNSIIWTDQESNSEWAKSDLPSSFVVKQSIIPNYEDIPFLTHESISVADPMFVDPLGPDGVLGTLDDNLELMGQSPAIGFGNSLLLPADRLDLDENLDVNEPLPVDFKGLRRISGLDGLDIGAFEYGSIPLSNQLLRELPFSSFCDGILVYPNPVIDLVYIDRQVHGNSSDLQFSGIFDLTGRRVLNKISALLSAERALNLTGLSPGVYAIRMSSSQMQMTCTKMVTKY